MTMASDGAVAVAGGSSVVPGSVTAATAGTLTGDSFAVFDFTSANEDLIVTVDAGSAQTISIVTNCDTTANCATALSGQITGASVLEAASGTAMVITSDTTGASSSVAITVSGSGTNALAVFGTVTAVGGVDAPSAIASRSLATSASAVRAPVYSVGIARLLRPKILIVG